MVLPQTKIPPMQCLKSYVKRMVWSSKTHCQSSKGKFEFLVNLLSLSSDRLNYPEDDQSKHANWNVELSTTRSFQNQHYSKEISTWCEHKTPSRSSLLYLSSSSFFSSSSLSKRFWSSLAFSSSISLVLSFSRFRMALALMWRVLSKSTWSEKCVYKISGRFNFF